MKKFKFFGMMAVAAMAVSCSSDDVVQQVQEDNAIQFSTYLGNAAQSRGSIVDNEAIQASGSGFGLFASYSGENNWAATNLMDFMYNQKVEYVGGAWSYTPIKYWPTNENDKISFFAYAPWDAAGISNFSGNDYAGIPYFTFSIQDNVDEMVDLVTDTRYNVSHDVTQQANPQGNIVNFVLRHELTRVTMKAKVDARIVANDDAKTQVVVTDIQLKGSASNFYQSGKYTFGVNDETRGTWSDLVVYPNDYPLANAMAATNNPSFVTLIGQDATDLEKGIWLETNKDAISLFGDGDYLFLIPPKGEEGIFTGFNNNITTGDEMIKAIITYYIVTEDANLAKGYSITKATKEVSLAGTDVNGALLKQGVAYAYTFTIGLDEIQVSATVEDWGDEIGGGSNVEYVSPDYPA